MKRLSFFSLLLMACLVTFACDPLEITYKNSSGPGGTGSPAPTATPNNCSFFGGTDASSQTASFGANSSVACSFTLSSSVTVTRMEVDFPSGGSGEFNLAIYDDNSGVPANVMVEGAPQSIAAGWNTMDIPSTTLNALAGPYWLAVKCSGSFIIKCDGAQSGNQYYAFTYWNNGTFDSAFNTGSSWSAMSSYTNLLSIQAVFCH